MNATSRKSTMMTLFTSPLCPYGHSVRIVMTEKSITADIEYIDVNEPPEDLIELNPYGTMPTFLDRDLVLYNSRIIMEYLDERFPHPPLYQMDPVARARSRMLAYRVDQDWYRLWEEIENSGEKKAARAKKMLRESLTMATPIFEAKPYFMSDDYSLIDCYLAPLLWRLPSIGVELQKQSVALKEYADRLFEREAFQESMNDDERELCR